MIAHKMLIHGYLQSLLSFSDGFARIWLSCLFSFTMLVVGSCAEAQDRYAFVVGIDNYINARTLQTARNDAIAISENLEDLGYHVTTLTDAGFSALSSQLTTFVDSIEPGDSVVFFFAGHGIEVGGSNYILPSDVPRFEASAYQATIARSLRVDLLLQMLEAQDPREVIVILDACRDDPFLGEHTVINDYGVGLVQIEPPARSFVLTSAGVGQTALDRLSTSDENENSVFTRNLLPLLNQKGISIQDLSEELQTRVFALADSVGHIQLPAYYSRLTRYFSFDPKTENPCKYARDDWTSVHSTNSIEVLEAFVLEYPMCSIYVAAARTRINNVLHEKPSQNTNQSKATREQFPLPETLDNDPLISTCDETAGNPFDPQLPDRVKGVLKIDSSSVASVADCEAAYSEFPSHSRSAYNYSRILASQNRVAKAKSIAELACGANHFIACLDTVLYGRNEEYLFSNGELELLERACSGGVGKACFHISENHHKLRDTYGREKKLRRACDLEFHRACDDLGTLSYLENPSVPNLGAARPIWERACQISSFFKEAYGLEEMFSCGRLRYVDQKGPFLASASNIVGWLETSCFNKNWVDCEELAWAILRSEEIQKRDGVVNWAFSQACHGGDIANSCVMYGYILMRENEGYAHLVSEGRRYVENACVHARVANDEICAFALQ